MKIYTRKGDDGTTGLFYGGRVKKDSLLPTAYGEVDEAQAAIGLARAHISENSSLKFVNKSNCALVIAVPWLVNLLVIGL